MSSIDPTQLYLTELRYWQAVHRTLCEIFGTPSEEARQLIDAYRAQLWDDAEPLERLLAFHAEPLDVAADLAGVESPTDSQGRAYDELVRGARRSRPAPERGASRHA